MVDDAQPWWRTAGGQSCDPDTHAYTLVTRLHRDGPVTFAVADDGFADNAGILTVTVEPLA